MRLICHARLGISTQVLSHTKTGLQKASTQPLADFAPAAVTFAFKELVKLARPL